MYTKTYGYAISGPIIITDLQKFGALMGPRLHGPEVGPHNLLPSTGPRTGPGLGVGPMTISPIYNSQLYILRYYTTKAKVKNEPFCQTRKINI